jgi:hypothetical protein
VAKRKRQYQVCIAKAADGSRCGKWALPGSTVCSAHDPTRKPSGIIAQQETDDPHVIYKRLMKDKDAQIRLRATNAYMDFLAKQQRRCATCAARADEEKARTALVEALTDEEAEVLHAALSEVNRIKALVYERVPHLRPAGTQHPRPTELDAQEANDGEESTATSVAGIDGSTIIA